MNCANCAEPLRRGAAYCERCGRRAEGTPAGSTPQNLLLAGGILGALLLLGGGLFFLFVGLLLATAFEPLYGSGGPEALLFFPLAIFGSVGAVLIFLAATAISLGAAWIWAVWAARRDLREGRTERGSMIAMLAGGLLVLLGFSTVILAIPGALVLAGGVLARRP